MKVLHLLSMILAVNVALSGQVSINQDGSSPASSAMLDIKSTESGLLIPRMTEAQRNAISSPEAGLMVFQVDGITTFYYHTGSEWTPIIGNTSGSQHHPGELFGGGVVFWVDHTGQHGLIVSMIDLGISQAWSNVTSTQIGISAQSEWDGLSNSNAIVGQSGHAASAASLCLDYTNTDYGTGIFSDWHLPSRTEMNDLWNQFKTVQKALETDGNPSTTLLGKCSYWSSTEYNNSNAWYFTFEPGNAYISNKILAIRVRAVRAF